MTDANLRLVTCIGTDSDLPLLPHFLRHYRALGVPPDGVIAILQSDGQGAPGLAEGRAILSAHGAAEPEIWVAPYTSDTMWAERRRVQLARCDAGDWVLSADVDEFQLWPAPLRNVLGEAERLGADCVQGVMIDRLAPGGRLAPVRPEPAILEQFPVRAEVASAIGGRSAVHGRGGTVKVMAARRHVLPSRGGHRPQDDTPARQLLGHPLANWHEIDDPAFRFAMPLQVHHVHWTETLPARLEKRLATSGVSPAGAEYGRRQLDHIARHGGIDLGAIPVMPDGADGPAAADWPRRLRRLRRMARRKRAYSVALAAWHRAGRLLGGRT